MKHVLWFPLFAAVAACSPDAPANDGRAAAPAEPQLEEPARVEAPSTPTPASGATKKPQAPGVDAPSAAKELSFTAPEGWISEPPSNAMRKGQYRLPPSAGDTAAAELVIFYSGKMGMGPLEANLNRWALQFEQTDGSKSRDKMTNTTRRVDAGAVTETELEGTYVAEKVMGSGERYHESGWKLMGAILESDHGPYYLKLVGPKATVEAHAAAFRAFVSSAK
ncbi:MAG: hypothetical protein IT454_14925 [Planctomycetes bacterium]|nr:hypothetical protein [Planctomycetota bacterium]